MNAVFQALRRIADGEEEQAEVVSSGPTNPLTPLNQPSTAAAGTEELLH